MKKEKKKKPRIIGSQLWSISCTLSNPPTVNVSDKTLPFEKMKIRALTPRAAARRYIRNNLASDLAKAHYYADMMDEDYYPPPDNKHVKSLKDYAKTATINVIKD